MKYWLLMLLLTLPALTATASPPRWACAPTAEDEMGPFYRPGAPLRDSVGTGYALSGTVRSALDCRPLQAARIEYWMAGPDGWYGEAYRGTLIAGADGGYRLSSHYPALYATRPAHIHLRASAAGFVPLVTQHYLEPGAAAGRFDLTLIPDPAETARRVRILHDGADEKDPHHR